MDLDLDSKDRISDSGKFRTQPNTSPNPESKILQSKRLYFKTSNDRGCPKRSEASILSQIPSK